MRTTRIISVLLVGALLAGLLCLTATAAQPELKLELKMVGQPQVGQEMTVELWCMENPGIIVAQFTLEFNRDVLDCVDCDTEEVLDGMISSSNANASKGAMIAAASATEIQRNGLLATYVFEVLAEGDCGFALTGSKFRKADGSPVTILISGVSQSVGSIGGSTGPVESVEPEPGSPYFSDIAGHWAEQYLNLCYERNLIAGYPNGTCGPNRNLTRAEFVTILYKKAGRPAVKPSTFVDLAQGEYYLDAVAWAQHTGLVAGKGANRFAPDDPITREEVAVILRKLSGNMTGSPFASTYDLQYIDKDEMSSWGRDPVYWAIYNKVWCGRGEVAIGNRLEATEPATRAEIAVMMINYQDNVER